MNEKMFNVLMAKDYDQAAQSDSPIDYSYVNSNKSSTFTFFTLKIFAISMANFKDGLYLPFSR